MSPRLVLVVVALLSACAPRLQAPGPLAEAPASPRLTEAGLVTADGVTLPVRQWQPAGPPEAGTAKAGTTKAGTAEAAAVAAEAVVVALHGFNDYSNAFAAPGAWLAARGFAVYAIDQRGFGASPAPGVWPGRTMLTADLRDMLAAAGARHPGAPVYALGESMGAAVVLAAWAERPLAVDGVILTGPAVWGRIVIPAYQTAALWLASYTVPWLTLTGRGLGIMASDNIEMLRGLGRDPLVIKETRVDAMWGLVNLMDQALRSAPKFDAPALILFGARDEVVPAAASLALLDRLPVAPARRIGVYENGYHMLLRDLQGEVVWTDMAAWMRDPTAPLPSGADRVDPQAALAAAPAPAPAR